MAEPIVMPLTTMAFEVQVALGSTPPCAPKLNASGVESPDAVVTSNVSLTPPMVRTQPTWVDGRNDERRRTAKVSPFCAVPAEEVHTPDEFFMYEPLTTDTGTLTPAPSPATEIAFEVYVVASAAPVTSVNVNADGVEAAYVTVTRM